MITNNIDVYIQQHSEAEPLLLQNLYREAHVRLLRPRMLSGHIQGRILSMISHMVKPKHILEIGTFAGYSALCLAEGLATNGKLITIEIDDEIEEFTQSFFNQSCYKHQIDFRIGNALKIVPNIDEIFDLVFIDADKRDYIAYFEAVFDKVTPGGFILVDNTLWDGKVLEPIAPNDAQTLGVVAFNEYIARENRVEKVILPIRDGLTLIRKK